MSQSGHETVKKGTTQDDMLSHWPWLPDKLLRETQLVKMSVPSARQDVSGQSVQKKRALEQPIRGEEREFYFKFASISSLSKSIS